MTIEQLIKQYKGYNQDDWFDSGLLTGIDDDKRDGLIRLYESATKRVDNLNDIENYKILLPIVRMVFTSLKCKSKHYKELRINQRLKDINRDKIFINVDDIIDDINKKYESVLRGMTEVNLNLDSKMDVEAEACSIIAKDRISKILQIYERARLGGEDLERLIKYLRLNKIDSLFLEDDTDINQIFS